MTVRPLPVPTVARPLPPIDPFRDPEAYRRVLSALYHLEDAALEGFRLLPEPAFVQRSEMFVSASQKLIRDEEAHLKDIETMIGRLGVDPGLCPPHPALQEFVSYWRTGRIFALPLRASVAAMFCLFSEGMGYAFLYNLAHATTDPDIRSLLMSNVRDEESHLRISMAILKRALQGERAFTLDFVAHAWGYYMLARNALRAQVPLLEDIGLDVDVIMGSSLRFMRDLVVMVLEDGGWRPAARLLSAQQVETLWTPPVMRAARLAMVLPEPPFGRQMVLAWGRLSQRLRPTTASSSAATA